VEDLRGVVERALSEDIGPQDITSEAVVPPDARGRAHILQKQAGVLFGLEAAAEAFNQAGADALQGAAAEGEWRAEVPSEVATVTGSARALLAAERTALNLLCHLSGVATLTAHYVAAIEGTGATILDTRKTTPGLRALDKAAVAAGGGSNHRLGLYDAVLIKENHVAIAGGLAEAVRRAREGEPEREIEVECRTLQDVSEALDAGADRLLLDNMGPDELRAAVAKRVRGSGVSFEASGGITLDTVRAVAETGVDYISVGALTHSASALDLSMEVESL
jgi:nicotinate-nucleotide pyrophosphorylase (carboxylating)